MLIDAGVPGCADEIVALARDRFDGTAPQAIVMTHGHFDHVGAFPELFEQWDVPVYAHPVELPHLPGWRWIHTPGHSDGHVSPFRDEDRLLVAGDAFVTTEQESLYAVMTQKQEFHGPPAYFTPDWASARASVTALAALRPAIAATGHGTPMQGEELRSGLDRLVRNFDEIAVPDHGRYVPDDEPSPM